MTNSILKRIVFQGGFDERDAFETPLRGHRNHVWVELRDGTRCQVTFYDPVRLAQTLADEIEAGRAFLADPGMIVLPVVTKENMEKTLFTLAEEGFFSVWKK